MSIVSIPQDDPPRLSLVSRRPVALSAETQREISPIRRQLVALKIAQELCDLDRMEQGLPDLPITRMRPQDRLPYERAALRVMREVVDEPAVQQSQQTARMLALEALWPHGRPHPKTLMAYHRAIGVALHTYQTALEGTMNPESRAHWARRWRHELAMATDREEGR